MSDDAVSSEAAASEAAASESTSSYSTSSDAVSSDAVSADTPKRDRSALRRSGGTHRRGGLRSVASLLGSVVWEVLLEAVFLVLVGLVSWLVYGELRWAFIAVVFLGVNLVLVLIALVVFARRRARRGRAERTHRDSVRDRTGL